LGYNVIYKKSVHRDLKKIDQAESIKILEQIERDLSATPEANPTLKGHFAGLRKYRIGDYRIIYALLGKDVVILRISHRRDAYK
jgi:mRNA interferase RelE/StbE